jgi:Cu/Ag efflux protein CusF
MRNITNIGILVLMAALPIRVRADQQTACTRTEKTWNGTLSGVNTQDNTVQVKRWGVTETFHLGKNCAIATVDKKEAPLSDLRPGEKVDIRYQKVEGVRVADRIAERALHYGGTVHAVDPKAGTVTMDEVPLYKPFRGPETFRVADDCKLTLATGGAGSLADVRPGDRITLMYELPGGSPVAYRIGEQTSSFVGKLEAMNLPARTLQAGKMTGEKTFQLADKCRFIASNQQIEPLKDLALGQQYRFTYRDVNGVNVLDQIVPAQEASPAQTASTK